MKLKHLITSFFAGFLFSCASTHPGNQGKALGNSNLPLTVSAQTLNDPNARKEPFQLVEVTFENTSDNWVKISESRLIIKNPAESKISVVLGKDLDYWAEAMKARLDKDQYNEEWIKTGIVTAGAIAMAAGRHNNDSGLAAAGALAVVGTTAWAVTDAIRFSLNKAEGVNKTPDNHLYHDFTVPPKMFIRRWLLVNKPSTQVINKLVLSVNTVEGDKDYYEIMF